MNQVLPAFVAGCTRETFAHMTDLGGLLPNERPLTVARNILIGKSSHC